MESSYEMERQCGPDYGPVHAPTKHDYFNTGDPRFNGTSCCVGGARDGDGFDDDDCDDDDDDCDDDDSLFAAHAAAGGVLAFEGRCRSAVDCRRCRPVGAVGAVGCCRCCRRLQWARDEAWVL